MSDSKRNPKDFPPDDFSKTTPNFRVPGNNYPSASNAPNDDAADDWAKTNYNFSPKLTPPADDWGRNVPPAAAPRQPAADDFGKTITPGSQPRSGGGDYGATQVNINIPRENLGGQNDHAGQAAGAGGATMPYFRLPESERQKYQNLPQTTLEPAAQAENEKKKGGVPGWLWAVGGLALLFILAIGVLGLVWVFFMPKTGFELTVKGAPPGSDIFVDGQRWNLSSADGSYKLPGLKAGEIKTIDIRRAGYTCKPQQVTGENDTPKEIVAQCSQAPVVTPPPPNDCANIKKGDFAKAAKCANDGLDNLKDPISVDDLLKAMNMYIINFPSGDFRITKPEDKAFLQKAAGFIQKLPATAVIEVGGHTDNAGNKLKNQKLSEDRAKSVMDELVRLGVKDTVLKMKGYGDAKPKASNDTDDGKFQNRRIEYSALSK